MAKVYQLKLVKQKLGKYSKVMGYDEAMLDETIEVQPEAECVKDDIKTAALEVMDVVDIPKANGDSEEVVVVETPKMDDTTVKVQSTETGVTADVPVEAFSKATKISKAKIKAYSEAEEAEKKAEAEEKKEDEPKGEEKPAEEPKSEGEKKGEGELKTASEGEGEEKKPEEGDEPKPEEKSEEKKSEGEGEEKETLETNSLAISLSDGRVYAYSCEGCEEIINEDGELDTVENLKEYCGQTETYGRNLFQKAGDKIMGRNAKVMEGLANLGVSRKTAKKIESARQHGGKAIRLGVTALVAAGQAKNFLKSLYAAIGGTPGIRQKRAELDELVNAVNPQDPEEVKKVASKLTNEAAKAGELDKVNEVKQEYKEKLATASQFAYSKFFGYKNAPTCLGFYSEENNEIVEEAQEAKAEAEEKKAEAAAEVAEKAAEVKQPEGTEDLPIVIKKVDNGYTITANGETKVADDVKSICNIVTELLEETKMDSYSQMVNKFRSILNG